MMSCSIWILEVVRLSIGKLNLLTSIVPTYKWIYERYYTVLNEIPRNKQGRKCQTILRLYVFEKNELKCTFIVTCVPNLKNQLSP